MTIPYERTRAVKQTEEFLLALCNPSKTPRVPKHIREWARGCLRHYPSQMDLISAKFDFESVFELPPACPQCHCQGYHKMDCGMGYVERNHKL